MGAGVGHLELCPAALWFRGGLNMMVVNRAGRQAGRMTASDALGRGEPGLWVTGIQGTSSLESVFFCERAVSYNISRNPAGFLLREETDLTWQLWGSLRSALRKHLPGKVISFMGPYYSSVIT